MQLELVIRDRASVRVREIVSKHTTKIHELSSGKFFTFGLTKLAILSELYSLFKIIRHSKYEQIVLCGNPGFLSALIIIFKRVDQLLSFPNAILFIDLPLPILDRLAFRFSIASCHRIDNLSEEPRNLIPKVLGTDEFNKKLRVAPCSFSDYEQVLMSERRTIDVAMVARFAKGKGYELLEQIDHSLSDYNVCIFGFGPNMPNVQNATISQTEKPFEVLSQAKIFLSIQEGNNYPSQSLLEAMASGCAIIATDVGETRKLLDVESALLIPYSSGCLINAIRRLLGDDGLRERLGAQARKVVLEFQTIDRYAEYFLEEII